VQIVHSAQFAREIPENQESSVITANVNNVLATLHATKHDPPWFFDSPSSCVFVALALPSRVHKMIFHDRSRVQSAAPGNIARFDQEIALTQRRGDDVASHSFD
jgi:hypothetical protein